MSGIKLIGALSPLKLLQSSANNVLQPLNSQSNSQNTNCSGDNNLTNKNRNQNNRKINTMCSRIGFHRVCAFWIFRIAQNLQDASRPPQFLWKCLCTIPKVQNINQLQECLHFHFQDDKFVYLGLELLSGGQVLCVHAGNGVFLEKELCVRVYYNGACGERAKKLTLTLRLYEQARRRK